MNDPSNPSRPAREVPGSEPGRLPPEDPVAAQLRGFGPLGLLSMLVIFAGNLAFRPLSAILVLLWGRRSRTPWRELGFAPDPKWPVTLAGGIALGVALKLVMKSVVMPLLGADPINHTYHYLAGNRAALPGAIYLMIVGAGFGEETVFRGFLFERMGRRLGTGRAARTLTVLVTSVLFAAAHFADQGLAGTEQALVTGLVFGALYLATGTLWLVMVAHAAFDLTALLLIYRNLETAVARFVFR